MRPRAALSIILLCVPLIAHAAAAEVAGRLSWPTQWQVFGPLDRGDPVLPADVLKSIPNVIEVGGRKLEARTVTATDSRLDLATLFGGVKAGNTAYVFLPLVAREDATVTLGMGADWWMQVWMDGQVILDTTTSRHGNVAHPPDVSDFMVDVGLTKGEHVLAVRFISGRASSVLALGGPDALRKVPVERYFEKALRSLRSCELDAAITQLTRVLDVRPDWAEAYFWRGMANYQQKAPARGLEDIRKADSLGYREFNRALLDIEKAPLFEYTPPPARPQAGSPPTASTVERTVRADKASFRKAVSRAKADGKAAVVHVVPAISDTEIRPTDEYVAGTLGGELFVSAASGEYEPASFVVSALADVSEVQLKVTDLRGAGADLPSSCVDIRVVQCWYHEGLHWKLDRAERVLAPQLLVHDDALVKVDDERKENYVKLQSPDGARYVWVTDPERKQFPIEEFPIRDSPTLLPVSIAAGTHKQFWVTVHVPEGTGAGVYTGEIGFVSAGESVIGSVAIRANVLPFELDPPYYTSGIYYESTLEEKGSLSGWNRNREQFRKELANLVAHGVTSPIMRQPYRELPEYHRRMREVLTIMDEVGMGKRPLYFSGLRTGAFVGNVPTVKRVMDFVRPFGIPKVYFYGIDEAGGAELVAQRPQWKQVRQAGGGIIVAGAIRQCYFPLMGDLLDVFVCSYAPREGEVRKWHSVGHKIWCYAYPQAGPRKPATFRRNYGLVLWKFNYDGAATWAYQGSGSHWNVLHQRTHHPDRHFTYPTVDGVIDTVPWEGYREAVDDVRYVTTLENMIGKAKDADRRRLRRSAARAAKYLRRLKSGNRIETEDLDTVRREIVEHILRLIERE